MDHVIAPPAELLVAAAAAVPATDDDGGPSSLTLHAYDIGTKHLAVCALTVTADPAAPRGLRFAVHAWNLINCAAVAGFEDLNVNRATQREVLTVCARAWALAEDALAPRAGPPPAVVGLEEQPRVNAKSTAVCWGLLTFLVGAWERRGHGAGLVVETISPHVKLCEAPTTLAARREALETQRGRALTRAERETLERAQYRANKAHGKAHAAQILREHGHAGLADWLAGLRAAKQDDLGDALLLGVYHAARALGVGPQGAVARPPRRRRRAPPPLAGRKRPRARPRAAVATDTDAAVLGATATAGGPS